MDSSKNDFLQLQGNWTIHSLQMEGRDVPPGGASLQIEGERFTTRSMGAEYSGIIELNASAEPKAFDLIFLEGPEKGNRALGIYQLEGDTWTLCLTVTAKVRPASFAAPAGSGVAVEVLRKGIAAVPVTAEMPPFPSPTIPDPDIEGDWKMLTCLRSGEPLEKRMLNSGVRKADAETVTVQFGAYVLMKAKYTTDRRAKPKSIDYLHVEGPMAGQIQLGIYKLDAGILAHCFAAPGNPRPETFESLPGDGRTFATWKRAE